MTSTENLLSTRITWPLGCKYGTIAWIRKGAGLETQNCLFGVHPVVMWKFTSLSTQSFTVFQYFEIFWWNRRYLWEVFGKHYSFRLKFLKKRFSVLSEVNKTKPIVETSNHYWLKTPQETIIFWIAIMNFVFKNLKKKQYIENELLQQLVFLESYCHEEKSKKCFFEVFSNSRKNLAQKFWLKEVEL